MKRKLTLLPVILICLVLFSCEKKDTNPFVGTWEYAGTSANTSVVVTLTFRTDMTMTMAVAVTIDDNTNTTTYNYSYSYTDSELTLQEAGGNPETTTYMISGNSLVINMGGLGLMTYTKI
ncbi:MAG: hypothetical protein GX622_09335 [Bacteroidales bacterium]|jgi:hypothetical protein|nr:hypothetical protein [Bacteroidales bacterium]